MPARSRARTWRGSGRPLSWDSAAGTRLSRTRAVFPAPDGPASAVRRCSAKAAVTSCRLYRSPTSIVIWPPGPGGAGWSRCTVAVPARNGPMTERGSAVTCPGVPWAMMVPPCAPAAGPSSMIQSAPVMRSRSCSTTTRCCRSRPGQRSPGAARRRCSGAAPRTARPARRACRSCWRAPWRSARCAAAPPPTGSRRPGPAAGSRAPRPAAGRARCPARRSGPR